MRSASFICALSKRKQAQARQTRPRRQPVFEDSLLLGLQLVEPVAVGRAKVHYSD
jgi:hypothetical protein